MQGFLGGVTWTWGGCTWHCQLRLCNFKLYDSFRVKSLLMFGSKRLTSFCVSGLSMLAQEMLQPCTYLQHQRSEYLPILTGPSFCLQVAHSSLHISSNIVTNALLSVTTYSHAPGKNTNELRFTMSPLASSFQRLNIPKKEGGADSGLPLCPSLPKPETWPNICLVTDPWLYCFNLVHAHHFLLPRGTTGNIQGFCFCLPFHDCTF